MNAAVAVIVAVVALAVVVVIVMRRRGVGAGAGGRGRRSVDNIDSFRRQIDALSPEARRQTSDRMKPSERSSAGDDGGDDH